MTAGGALLRQAPPTPHTTAALQPRRLPVAAAAPAGPCVAVAALAGTTLSFLLPALPSPTLLLALLALGAGLWWRAPRWRCPAALTAGLAWAALHGAWAMQQRLPVALEGQDLVADVQVQGLPVQQAGRLRADLRLLQVPSAPQLRGGRVRVARYGGGPELAPGSRWRLTLRLRRPRGLANPGGFDFERFALERRIIATGYVREGPVQALQPEGQGVDRLRADISAQIALLRGAASSARYLQALAVADTRGLSDQDWALLRATGITHLIAISGLHVTLVAGFGAVLARLLYRLLPGLGLRLPLPQGAALAALLSAGGYTALAGFGLPTLRTLAMIAAALLAVLLRRATGAWQAFALALLALLAVDPLAALGAGFWLSFLGVAWLLWCMPRGSVRGLAALRELGVAQWVMTLGLLPLTVWFFGQASLAGPFANLVAVPWVSLVVVPLTLLATLLHSLPWLANAPLALADYAMRCLLWLLEAMAGSDWALAWLPEPTAAALLLACAGAAWLLLPRGVPGRPLALLLFAPLLLPDVPRPAPGDARVSVLDVGQGLSLLVRTRTHALLYDAGSARGDLDLGDAVVLPALRALGVRRLDRLLVSHGDNDHAGGTAAVLRAYAPELLTGEPRRLGAGRACVAGERWTWDGVAFELLHPPRGFPELGNESSCVLRVRTRHRTLLLAGDVSSLIEQRLLTDPAPLRADVALVPHHGSRSSSAPSFVAATGASLALVSAGHRNRFGHPVPEVVQRWHAAGAHVASTAHLGAITIDLDRDMPVARGFRSERPRYWREP